VGINFWVEMLNNANNFSNYFDYDKIAFPPRIVYRLMGWYLLTLVIAFVNNLLLSDLSFAFITFITSLISDGFLFVIVIQRVSRFKVLKANYTRVMPALPFYITRNRDEDFSFFHYGIRIRGENFQDHILTRYLNRDVIIFPLSKKKTTLRHDRVARVTGKTMLFDDVVVYTIAFENFETPPGKVYLLKPKTAGTKTVDGKYPIHGLFTVNADERGITALSYKQLKFVEWVYIDPYT
jgi:hypothetical protein